MTKYILLEKSSLLLFMVIQIAWFPIRPVHLVTDKCNQLPHKLFQTKVCANPY